MVLQHKKNHTVERRRKRDIDGDWREKIDSLIWKWSIKKLFGSMLFMFSQVSFVEAMNQKKKRV